MKDAAQGVAQDIEEDVAQDLAFSPSHQRRRRRLCAIRAEMGRIWAAQWHLPFRGRNWAAKWHLARAVGKRFRGCRAKAPLC